MAADLAVTYIAAQKENGWEGGGPRCAVGKQQQQETPLNSRNPPRRGAGLFRWSGSAVRVVDQPRQERVEVEAHARGTPVDVPLLEAHRYQLQQSYV